MHKHRERRWELWCRQPLQQAAHIKDYQESKRCNADEKEIKSTIEVEYEDKKVPFDIAGTREDLRSYNALLRETQIDIGAAESPLVTREYFNRKQKRWETRRISLRHDNKFVRRIFYRKKWNLGGRYHGGWWQQIPSELRKDILINDQYTVEVDYSGFHVSIAYGLEGLQPPQDPYTLSVLFKSLTAEQQRSDVKLLALTAINAKDRKSTYSAFRDEKNREQRHLPTDQKIRYTNRLLEQLLDQFVEENRAIEHYICADKGVDLMAIDGRITTRIIDHFTRRNIPLLTVHDSYVIQSEHEAALMKQMEYATEVEIGDFYYRKKQEKVSPFMLATFAQMDRQINVLDGYTAISNSIVRTEGYKKRHEKFIRYKKEYHTEG